ncbi:hypothetical protein GCM10007036_30210 [Alsobacter metallidurans]|uniref:Carrier domain-containing protein n=1 Tax=Alsobacter metallidurans TaxID=340221 RepID=A0A917MIK8_9HYPH|nr:hypothetical protein GCM10007036_30210 [Alsobacter metallidurans]
MAFTAALLDGVVPVMLTHDTAELRAQAVGHSVEPKLVICDLVRQQQSWTEAHPVTFAGSPAEAPQKSWRLFGSGKVEDAARRLGLDLPLQGREPRLPEALDEIAYILFTSGTTQSPSGVMLSRRNLLANLATLSRLFAYDPSSRIFNDMVLAHGDGLVQGPMLALANGCALIRSGGFTVPGLENWLNRVRQERASHVITVPAVWSLIDRYAQHNDYFDAPECKGLLSVAARLDPALWLRLETRFGRPVFNQYGLTETVASALYAGPQAEMGAFGTIGRPVDCDARIAPLPGGAAADGSGELQLRGDNVFPGYWRDAARTAATFTPDGWMRTGDLAVQGPEQSFDIVGRIKTVIMSGGFLIRPDEIDEAMLAHENVIESATVALPDETFGEVPVTAVVIEGSINEATLTSHARANLEPLKVPKRILALPAIPRGDAGKPNLGLLREAIAASLAQEGKQSDGDGRTTGAAALATQVLGLAAEVFRVEPTSLSTTSTPASVAAWDSFSQLSLVFAAEERFKIRIPAARVAGLRSLADLVQLVSESKR